MKDRKTEIEFSYAYKTLRSTVQLNKRTFMKFFSLPFLIVASLRGCEKVYITNEKKKGKQTAKVFPSTYKRKSQINVTELSRTLLVIMKKLSCFHLT